MKYDPQFIGTLLARHLMIGLCEEEREILDEWAAASWRNRSLLEELEDPERRARLLKDYAPIDSEALWLELVEMEPKFKKPLTDTPLRPSSGSPLKPC